MLSGFEHHMKIVVLEPNAHSWLELKATKHEYLTAVVDALLEEGHVAYLIEAHKNDLSEYEVCSLIETHYPDFICIELTSPTVKAVQVISRILKRRFPEIPIAALLSRESDVLNLKVSNQFPDINFLLRGKKALIQLLASLPSGNNDPGQDFLRLIQHPVSETAREQLALGNSFQELRHAFRKRGNPKIFWLASYPRAGNTYTRFVLANYILDSVKNSIEVEETLPDLHKPETVLHGLEKGTGLFEFDGNRCLIVKTHYPFSFLMPLVEYTKGVIFIHRHPFEVAVSDFILSEYFPNDPSEKERIRNYFNYFTHYGCSPTGSILGFGGWKEHLFSWNKLKTYSSIPFSDFSFPDIINNCSAFTRMLRLLGFQVDTNRLQRAFNNSDKKTVKHLQRKEIQDGIPGVFRLSDQGFEIITDDRTKEKVRKLGRKFYDELDRQYQMCLQLLSLSHDRVASQDNRSSDRNSIVQNSDPTYRECCNPQLQAIDPLENQVTSYGRPAPPEFVKNREIQKKEIEEGAICLRSYPTSLAVALTSRCNLSCIMCRRNYMASHRVKRDFPFEFWPALKEMLPYAELIVFGNAGEFFMYPNIKHVLRDLISFPHLFKVVTTNGTLLDDPELFELTVHSIDRLGISIEGATRGTYEEIRRGASFDKLINNIKRITEFSHKNGNPIEIIFQTIPMRKNLFELPMLLDLAHELGIRHIACQHLICVEGMEKFKEEQSIFKIPSQWNAILQIVKEKAERLAIDLNFPGELKENIIEGEDSETSDASDMFRLIDQDKNRFLNPKSKCFDPWFYMQVGLSRPPSVSPCCYIRPYVPDMYPSFKNIWNSEKIQDVRRWVNSPNTLDWPQECRQCQKRF